MAVLTNCCPVANSYACRPSIHEGHHAARRAPRHGVVSMGDDHPLPRWQVALATRGAQDAVQSRLLMAGLESVTWYRRRGRLMVSVKLYAPSKQDAESAAIEVLGHAQVEASVVRSKHLD